MPISGPLKYRTCCGPNPLPPSNPCAAKAVSYTHLAQAGVSFRVCANAMKKVPITKEDLLPCVEVVPAGVVEIVRLQREDFAYIKP